jgi:hypothetical protein
VALIFRAPFRLFLHPRRDEGLLNAEVQVQWRKMFGCAGLVFAILVELIQDLDALLERHVLLLCEHR